MSIESVITIKVPLEVAQTYQNALPEEQKEIETRLAFFLQTIPKTKDESINKLRETMTEIGQKAIERGLTPEILESILNED